MKKGIKSFLNVFLLVVLVFVLSACGGEAGSDQRADQSESDSSSEKIIIGVTANNEGIAQEVANLVKEDGYDVGVEVFQDSMSTNEALNEGKIQLNFTQHEIYMENFNESRDADLVKVGDVLYNQQVGLFSEKYQSVDDIEDGSLIAIDNNPVNMDRAIKVLADTGLIGYDKELEESGKSLSVLDITENPKNLEFKEASGSALVKTMEDTDGAMFSGQMAATAGYGPDDALALYERDDLSKYGMILASKSGDEDSDWAKAIHEAFKAESVQKLIEEQLNGMWTPNF